MNCLKSILSKLIYAIAILAVLLPLGLSAKDQNDWSDLEFKLQLEKFLTQQVKEMVEGGIEKSHYYFSLSVTVAPPPKMATAEVNEDNFLPLVSEEELVDLQKNTDRIYLDKIGGVWSRSTQKIPKAEARSESSTIQRIDATLILDESVDQSAVTPIKTLVEALLKTYTAKVNFNVQKGKIYIEKKKEIVETPPPPVEKPMAFKDWLQLLKEQIALLIAVLVGLVGYIFANSKRVAVEKEKAAAMAASSSTSANDNGGATNPSAHGSVETKSSSAAGAATVSTPLESRENEIVAFQQKLNSMFDEQPNDLKILLKEWLPHDSNESTYALTLLSRTLPITKLQKITSLLSNEEKEAWKKKISPELNLDQTLSGIQFIQSGISKHFLTEVEGLDAELRELVSVLPPRDAVDLVRSSPHLSAFLFNQLSTLQLSRVFSLLANDELSKALKDSVSFTDIKNASLAEEVKNGIRSVQSKNKQVTNPFIERSFDLIKHVPASKEYSIFEAIASIGHDEALSRLSTLCLPSDIICDLPATYLLSAFNKFSVPKRIEIILSRNDEEKKKLLNCFGVSGKLREMIDLEIDTVASNEIRMRSIEKSKDIIWNDYLKVVREIYRSQQDEPIEIEDLRKNWIKSLMQKSSVQKNSNAKAA